MPTLRSHFNFQQFEEVLQKLAHEIALDAVKNLNQGDVRIVIHGSRLDTVETDKAKIRFYAKHVSYSEEPTRNYKDWLGFDVEEKLYLTSNYCTKISFHAPEGKGKEIAEKITEFIDKIMAEASIKPVPRFSLSDVTQKSK
jgi:acylphosphatase